MDEFSEDIADRLLLSTYNAVTPSNNSDYQSDSHNNDIVISKTIDNNNVGVDADEFDIDLDGNVRDDTSIRMVSCTIVNKDYHCIDLILSQTCLCLSYDNDDYDDNL